MKSPPPRPSLTQAATAAERAIDQALAAGRREASRSFAVILAIRHDHLLQAMLRRAGGATVVGPFLLRLGDDPVWVSLGARQGGALSRLRRPGVATSALPDLLAMDDRLRPVLDGACVAQSAAADALADAAFGRADPSADAWASLQDWSPALEGPAYRVGLRLSTALSDLERPLRQAARPPRATLMLYWDGVELLRRASALACRIEARPQLSAMAGRFDWARISPTWPLIRQRSLGLAATAARAAAAFGPDAVPNYLRRFEGAKSRLARFDALFGLTAIALAEPKIARHVVRDLKRVSASLGGGEADAATAIAALDGGLRARNSRWLLQAHLAPGRGKPPADWRDVALCDPLLELPDGALAAFAGLTSLAARGGLGGHPGPAWAQRIPLTPEDVHMLIRRADLAA